MQLYVLSVCRMVVVQRSLRTSLHQSSLKQAATLEQRMNDPYSCIYSDKSMLKSECALQIFDSAGWYLEDTERVFLSGMHFFCCCSLAAHGVSQRSGREMQTRGWARQKHPSSRQVSSTGILLSGQSPLASEDHNAWILPRDSASNLKAAQ